MSLVLIGCSAHIEPVLARRPLVERLPLSVGVYFTPEFRAYRNKCETFICTEYEVGPPSVALFELILAALFENTVVLTTMPPPEEGQRLAGIIVPAITHFNPVEITYQLTFHSRAGVELGSWEVDGAARGFASGAERPRSAMRDAAAKCVRGLRQQLVIRIWLQDAGVNLWGAVSNPLRSETKERAPP